MSLASLVRCMLIFWQRRRLLIPVVMFLSLTGVGPASKSEESTPLRLQVSPMTARAPADVYIYVSVAPRSENRLIRVVAESDDFYRSSEAQLDGEYSARVSVFKFRELPSGEYRVRVELIVSTGRTSNVETRAVQVL